MYTFTTFFYVGLPVIEGEKVGITVGNLRQI